MTGEISWLWITAPSSSKLNQRIGHINSVTGDTEIPHFMKQGPKMSLLFALAAFKSVAWIKQAGGNNCAHYSPHSAHTNPHTSPCLRVPFGPWQGGKSEDNSLLTGHQAVEGNQLGLGFLDKDTTTVAQGPAVSVIPDTQLF